MIGVDDLHKLLQVALYTGRVADERPLSLLIIATVGAGKSEVIAHYPEVAVNGVLYANDITAFALHKRHGKELRSGKIHHILMPDLLVPLNKQKEQTQGFVTFMNGIIEEGLARVESRDSNFVAEVPVRCGFITSIARQDFGRWAERWAAVGFLSRMLPVSYKYSQETVDAIMLYIMKGGYHGDEPFKLALPAPTKVDLPLALAEAIKPVALELKDEADEYGFRRLKQLQVLLKGFALMAGRHQVTEADCGELERLKGFLRKDCTQEL